MKRDENPDSTPTERDDVTAVLAEALCRDEHRPTWWGDMACGACRIAADRLAPLIAAREQAARAEALREAALEGAGEAYVAGLRFDAVAVDWLRERANQIGGGEQ